MKKTLLLFVALLCSYGIKAAADEFNTVTLTDTAGQRWVFSAKALTMQPMGETLLVSNSAGESASLPIDRLAGLKFGNEQTSALLVPASTSGIAVFNLQGRCCGNFASVAAARATLTQGIYIMKSDCATTKFIVR